MAEETQDQNYQQDHADTANNAGEQDNQEIKFSDEAMKLVNRIIARYPEERKKSALLPVMHLAQAEFGGWLSPRVMDYVAEILDLQSIEVYEVATFYTQFYTEPVGKYVLEVCHTGPCWLRGSEEIMQYIENKLGINRGETTPDGMFTLKGVECLASCGTAPMMQVGFEYCEDLDEEKVDACIEKFRKENKIRRVYPI